MRTNIGFIRNENGIAVFENTLYEIDRKYNLLVKYKIIKHIFSIYDDYIKLMKVLGKRNKYIILCEESCKVRNLLVELPDVVKQIQKDCLETKDKNFDSKVERFLYERFKYIFSRKKNDWNVVTKGEKQMVKLYLNFSETYDDMIMMSASLYPNSNLLSALEEV